MLLLTPVVFAAFSVLWLGEAIRRNDTAAFAGLIGAATFIFLF